VRSWLAATPPEFRFSVKGQRGATIRALYADSQASVDWLVESIRPFGDRLGTVLYRVPEDIKRNDERLAGLLAAWPADVPLTLEFQDPTWHVDEVFAALAAHNTALCATDLDELPEPPTLRVTGSFLYLRLRRTDYSSAEVTTWAARIEPFLRAGHDVYVFFKHDATGNAARLATDLTAAVDAVTAGAAG